MSVRAAFVPKSYDLKVKKLDLKPVDEDGTTAAPVKTSHVKGVGFSTEIYLVNVMMLVSLALGTLVPSR